MPFACASSTHCGPQAAACCRKCYELVCATCPPTGCSEQGEHDVAFVRPLAQLFRRRSAAPDLGGVPDRATDDGRRTSDSAWRQDLLGKVAEAREQLAEQKRRLTQFYHEQSAFLESAYQAEIAKALSLLRLHSASVTSEALSEGGGGGSFGGGGGPCRPDGQEADAGRRDDERLGQAAAATAARSGELSTEDDGRPLLVANAHAHRPAVELETLSWRRLTQISTHSLPTECSGIAYDGAEHRYYLACSAGIGTWDESAAAAAAASPAAASAAAPALEGQRWLVTGAAYSAIVLTSGKRLVALNSTKKAVQTFSAAGELISEFPLVAAEKPNGLCQTDEGLFLVTDIDANKVSLYDPSGELTAEINKIVNYKWVFFSPECAACIGQRRFVVTDGKRCCVLCLDYGGKLVWRFGRRGRDGNDLWAPAGVCTDQRGRIYVGDKGNLRVAIITTDGKLVGHVSVGPAGARTPCLANCSADGNCLVVVCNDRPTEQTSIHAFSIEDF